jgi:hypothetical protein
MKLAIRKLKFSVSDQPFGANIKRLDDAKLGLQSLASKVGTENTKFKSAFATIYSNVKEGNDLTPTIDSKLHVRALAISLQSPFQALIKIHSRLLRKIDSVLPKPSTLLTEAMYQYVLSHFDKIEDLQEVLDWLKRARISRNLEMSEDQSLLAKDGPQWIAKTAIESNIDFDNLAQNLGLKRFAEGRFLTLAKRCYYVEQLDSIPVNQAHDILLEVQKKEVYNSAFDENDLLGHKILNILISRAPQSGISDEWRNVIMSIAGDPRIPKSHPNYRKWWSHVDESLIQKVRGWLSKLDLRLFLEALHDYSETSGDPELLRMYPSRKRFLEGLYDAGLVSHTRLYMSMGASSYLNRNYNKEHLPSFSHVKGDKSIVYLQLGDIHIVEGSHSCYLWIYRQLDSSAFVLDYSKNKVTYSDLTSGMARKMEALGSPPTSRITHQPSNFKWQRDAIQSLKSLGIDIDMKDVLSPEDYSIYVRRFGVRSWA